MAEQMTVKHGAEVYGAFRRLASKRDEANRRALADAEARELCEIIHDAWLEWQNALMNFENADCKDMVDYYSYRIKASEIRYEYLLRKAKDMQVRRMF
jgi:hypothetical protein